MPQSNLSFEQRNLLGPVTSTSKNWFHQWSTSLTLAATMIYYSNTQFPSDGMAFFEAHKELRHSHVFLRCIKRSPGGVYVWFMLDVTTDILILFLQFLSDNVVQPCSGKWSQSRSGPNDKTRPSSILPDGLRLCCGQ